MSAPTRDELLAAMPRRFSHLARGWAERTPGALAIRAGNREFSYADLGAAIDEARRLLGDAGVRPGDRVVIANENGLAACALLLAAGEIDAWAAPINARISGREIDEIIASCEARCAIFTSADSDAAAAHAARHRASAYTSPLFGEVRLAADNGEARPERVHEDAAQQTALLIFTSGTTGRPKGVMLSHRAIMYNGALGAIRRGVRPGDCFYGASPLSHVIGLGSGLAAVMWGGAAIELVARFSPAHLAEALESGRITQLVAVPTLMARLLEHAESVGVAPRAPALRLLSVGGAPLDLELKRRIERVFGVPLGNGYGLSEMSPIAGTLIEEPVTDDSVGTALPGVEVRIVDPEARDLPAGAVGELWARGPHLMQGYYRDAEASRQAVREGWLATGDLARRDDGGRISIVGRSKELIIRSGFNVYPAEVEGVLVSHPAVLQAAVVGRKISSNEEVIAYVQPLPSSRVTAAELSAFLADRLAPYKRPARIFVMEALPLGPTGKIWKSKLSELASQLEP